MSGPNERSHTAAGIVTPERHGWMDLARGMAIILVIIRHAGEVFRRVEPVEPGLLESINYALGPYRIPLLIFLSGLLLNRSLDKGLPRFTEGKIKNLLWPFLAWTVIYFIVSGEPVEPEDAKYVLSGTYLWYISFLLLFFALAAIFARVPHLVVASFALAIAMLAPDGTRYGEMLFLLMCYFFLGAFAGQNLELFTKVLQNRWTPFLIITAVPFAVLSVAMGGARYETETAALAIISIIAFCSIVYRLQRFSVLKPISYLGRQSLIFYVVHFPLLFLLLDLLDFGASLSREVFMLIAIPLSFIVPTLIARNTQRSPLLRALFAMPLRGSLLSSPAYRTTLGWLDRKFGVSESKHRRGAT